MIRSYQYIETAHANLHESILAFFRKIKTDTEGFRDELFEPDFLPIVKRHRTILKKNLKEIYEYVVTLSPTERHDFCDRIIDSNKIEQICNGQCRASRIDNTVEGIDKKLRDMFIDLYDQVLDGDPFRNANHMNLRDHFNQFCNANKDITLCPICGIGELKKEQDKTRDQYDHFLPKTLYPFSAVNFRNLVPCCKECNSFDAKGEKDTLAISTGRLFFPYDQNHKGISLEAHVQNDHDEIENIKLTLSFTNPDGKQDEIESWKTIYSIEDRYQGYIKARIEKWYKVFFSQIRNPILDQLSLENKMKLYMDTLQDEESFGLTFIRRPIVEALIRESNCIQAQIEASRYA